MGILDSGFEINPKPETKNQKPKTRNQKPETKNPKPLPQADKERAAGAMNQKPRTRRSRNKRATGATNQEPETQQSRNKRATGATNQERGKAATNQERGKAATNQEPETRQSRNEPKPMNRTIPPIVKNLLIINGLLFLASFVLAHAGIADLNQILGLYYFKSEHFEPYQFITHMFMHDNQYPFHLIFNMYALWMFGSVLEQVWGPKRFLIFYMVTGLGAAVFHTFVNYLMFHGISQDLTAFTNTPTPEVFQAFLNDHVKNYNQSINVFINSWQANPSSAAYIQQAIAELQGYYQSLINVPTIGASGAVFGLLLGFGMLFPNTQLMLLFPPIPIKAKWFVLGYGAIELFLGLSQQNSNIAHFAHLGGMLFGFLLIKYWNKDRLRFY